MSEKRFIVFPNNVVWDNQLGKVVCRCIIEGIGDTENVCQLLNKLYEENEQLQEIINKLEEAIEKRGYDSIDEFW